MELQELIEHYPLLYHMAERKSWPSIQAHGLRSTSSLLDLYEITGDDRIPYESQRRPTLMGISHKERGKAVLRDNKPITDSKLAGALQDGITLEEWYRLLNGKVFFWLTNGRLVGFLNARSYRDRPHNVITIRTADLLARDSAKVWLSPMNTGTTAPIAHPRGRNTFMRIADFPFEERKKRGQDAIVELAIDGLVEEVESLAESVTVWLAENEIETIWRRG